MTMLRNGKELAQAIAEFRKDKEPTFSKFGKYDYFKIEEYVDLLDQCFGVDGYTVDYTEAGTVTVSPTQVVYNVKATVSIYGEDGSVVYRFSGWGTHEPIREAQKDENGKPITGTFSDRAINLETLGMVGCVNALKSACTQLGCFGMRNLEGGSSLTAPGRAATPKPAASSRPAASQSRQNVAPAAQAAPDEEKSFFVNEAARDGGKDRNGNAVFILPCHEIVDGKPVEKKSEIIFYSNFYKEPARLAKLTNWNGVPSRYRFRVRKIDDSQRKNKDALASYTFRGFSE